VKACKFETGRDVCEYAYGVRTDSWRWEPQLVAERERARALGVVTVGRATTFKQDPILGIMNALSSLRSVYVSINIDSRAWDYRNVRSGMLLEYDYADRGAHAVVVAGYRPAGLSRQFLLHNSWGTGWGDGGYVWISEAALRKHLNEAYVVDAAPVGAPVPAAPSFPPSWTPSAIPPLPGVAACAAGTGFDIGAGRCAPLCRSGLAPFVGQCPFG
jgi:hypothetical protein